MNQQSYEAFLAAKVSFSKDCGMDVDPSAINPWMKPHAAALAMWAIRKGRAAIFASFGLHKTSIQLEIARLMIGPGERALIVAPLGVRQEFRKDADKLGTKITSVRRSDEVLEPGIYVTNYESCRDGKLDPALFTCVSLDEAAVLRGFGGSKTFREFMRIFEGIKYKFVATATPSPNEYIELLAYAAFLGVMDVGQAKAQPLDAKVLTPNGWTSMGEVQVGDLVTAGDGTPTKVLGVYPQGPRPIFKVSFSDGSSTECDANHLWLTSTHYERNNERKYKHRNGAGNDGSRNGTFASVRTTAEIAATLRMPSGLNHVIPLTGPVQFAARALPMDPWTLGVLLGDGCLRDTAVTFSTADEWMLNTLEGKLPEGLSLRETADGSQDYGVTTTGRQGGKGPGSNPLLCTLRGMGLLGKRAHEKSIPEDYLFASVEDRLALLRGLMDTDGSICPKDGQTTFCTVSRIMADQVVQLVQSLGGVATVRLTAPCKFTRHQAFLVEVRLDLNPFALPRKATHHRIRNRKAYTRYITAVEPVGIKPAQCIAIEHPSRLYVTDDFLVTHNTRFFKRDSSNADKLTIHPHKEREFWHWVASWAIFLTTPSDLGFDDTGYVLPPVEIHWHEVPSDHSKAGQDRDGQGRMFRNAAIGVSDAAAEKRSSLKARVAKMMELRALDPAAHRVLWHDLEDERRAIEAAIPDVVSVYGSLDLNAREKAIIAFSDGEIQELAGKPSITGAGCNFQRHCAWSIFLGIGFRFHDFAQAIHRIQRFGQTRPVRIDLIYTEAERDVRRLLEEKWSRHKELVSQMRAIVREHGLTDIAFASVLRRSMGVERQEASGDGWRLINNDAVIEAQAMASDSVDLIVTSVPFATQYEYTPTFNDFGHTDDNEHFWAQMDYLTAELLRVLRPGRDCVIHVKDRIIPGGLSGLGFQTLNPFHAEAIYHYQRHGFAFLGMKTVTTDVVRENNQTYRLGWSEQCKDGTRMGCGVPEYVLIFRKPPTDSTSGYADVPVVKEKPHCTDKDGAVRPFDKRDNWKHPVPGTGYSRAAWQLDAHGYTRSSGDRLLSADELRSLPHEQMFKRWEAKCMTAVYDYREHLAACEALDELGRLPATFMLFPPHSPHPDVWTDITRMRTLNGEQVAKGREVHLCPLQFDIVDRVITQLSMPGETVFDPFAGIGTVPLRAMKLGRKGLGTELSAAYWRDAVTYCRAEEVKAATPSLFDILDAQDAMEREAA